MIIDTFCLFLHKNMLWVLIRMSTNNICFYGELTKIEPPHDKTNKMTVRPAKTQISLGIRPVWSESSLCSQWLAKNPSFLHADSEDSDQTGRMPRLIWVFAGHTLTLLVLSWGSSIILQLLWNTLSILLQVEGKWQRSLQVSGRILYVKILKIWKPKTFGHQKNLP